VPGAGEALAGVVLRHCPPPAGALVAGFWPMGDEIDIRPLMRRLEAAGHALALPVTTPRGQPLVFRRWRFGDPLVPGRFDTSVPPESAPTVTPDALLVPLLAFDAGGLRLGYGGGYYDRTLAGLPGAWALGVAFAGQQVAKVPAGAHDVPLHGIATEAGFLRTEG
jgi:5-formyltetrahydrofolate cyclo-ligase